MKILFFKTNLNKYKLKNILKLIIFLLTLLTLLILSKNVQNSVRNSVDIFLALIIPSLFPFIIISELALNTSIFNNISNVFGNTLSKLFKIPADSSIAIIIGFLCGFPSGGKTVNLLYEQKKINKQQAYILLSFVNNNNPAFIISTIGIGIFNNFSIGVLLLISHYSASILTGIFYSRYISHNIIHENIKISNRLNENNVENDNIIETIKKCILNSLITLGVIFGFIAIFNILFDLLNILLNHLNINSNIIKIISALIEITRGSKGIISTNFDIKTIICLESFLLGFSGLCIIFQIYSTISKNSFSFFKLLMYKIFHGILSIIITYILIRYTNILDLTSITISSSIDNYIGYNNYRARICKAYIYSLALIIFSLSVYMIIVNINKNKKNKKFYKKNQ